MKKYLIGIVLLFASLAALTGCGGPPLEEACADLNALSPAVEDESVDAAVSSGVAASYHEDKDQLVVSITGGTDLDAVFDTLNKDIDGEEVGTIVFLLDGSRGDGYENELDQKISRLSCDSMEGLGLNYYIMQAESHSWTGLSKKTEKLYFDGPPSVFLTYTDAELEQLAGFTDVSVAYADDYRYKGISRLLGAQMLSLVEPIEGPEAGEDAEAAAAEDDAKSGDGEDADAEDADDEGDGDPPGFAPVEFTYSPQLSKKIVDISRMPALSTVLIYPETGYTLGAGGETFLATLQCLKPELMTNPPDEEFTEQNLVFVSDVETPGVSQAEKDSILAGFLKPRVKTLYTQCSGFGTKGGDAVVRGNCLIYHAEPEEADWGSARAYSASGIVLVTEPAAADIDVPASVDDYQTFVYIYPIYEKTGSYNTGTEAYRQTLRVQVFDLKGRTAYEAKSVGTAEAPKSFSYYVGEPPEKKSGEVSLDAAYEYLNGLKKQ